jgi:hypothetical protein
MNYSKLFKILAAAGETVRHVDSDDILDRIGLERKSSTMEKVLTTFGIFGAGMVIGAGVGLLVSPVAPEDVRKKIAEGAKSVKNEIQNLMSNEEEGTTGSGLLAETPSRHQGIKSSSHAS